ncbi:sensor histidine kinase [Arthrobacter halodurans]|uniref:Oxygen sensor histidine kinase NreB n=1 Tax=Arthrobacter halodurans TaxID=516699 RepID=A0ABV4URM6_9MICC
MPDAASRPSPDVILRFLRGALHVGFALLLGVAIARMHTAFGDGGDPHRYLWSGVALLLAAVYVAGTVTEKRFAAGRSAFDPRRYGVPWLGIVTALWAVLLAGSPDFSWLAFPLFFLHLHLLPRRAALPAIAAMTAAVVASQWAGSGLAVPPLAMVLGPVFGAAFAVVTGLVYRALYREARLQRSAADELRRTRAELARTQHDAGVLAERARLAREIHDTLAQGLSSIVLLSRAAEASLAGGDAGTAGERVSLIGRTASENLAEARGFVRGLSSPLLERASLLESLRRLCESTTRDAAARGSRLRCRFELEGSPATLPAPHAVTLLRAAQASLANVAEHADAGTAVVTLAFLGDEVTLDIYDDGAGFDPDGAPERAAPRADGGGFGLRALRERVGALDGVLALESAPGEGTVVGLRLPLPRAAGDAA